jgi:hypothetical protein
MNAEHPAVAERTAEPAADREPAPAARVRRPALPRKEPLRHASALLRATQPAQASTTPATPPEGAHGHEGPVARGVRLGYEVIEEQILQGQKLAQRIGRAAGQAGRKAASAAGIGSGHEAAAEGPAGGANAGELIDRVLGLYKDIGSLCVDAVETLARSPVLRAGVARMSTPAAAPAAAPTASNVALDIQCNRRVQVTLDLQGRAGALRVHALHAADPGIAPLTGVHFDTESAHHEPVLRLVVSDAQASATYTGVVVDAATNESRGFLTVRVLG